MNTCIILCVLNLQFFTNLFSKISVDLNESLENNEEIKIRKPSDEETDVHANAKIKLT